METLGSTVRIHGRSPASGASRQWHEGVLWRMGCLPCGQGLEAQDLKQVINKSQQLPTNKATEKWKLAFLRHFQASRVDLV